MLDTKYNPETVEQLQVANDAYTQVNDSHEYFSILMPPPNVTGSLHLGHALTYTLQDILIRYYRQKGISTYWQPGLDHAGIATQLVVEKWLEKQGINYKKLNYQDFLNKVLEWKNQSATDIVNQQKALGCSANWNNSRFTMDEGFSKAVTEAFVTLYENGLIYKAKRLVNWDIKLGTAISDLEIKNVEETGTLWYINYQVVDYINNDTYTSDINNNVSYVSSQSENNQQTITVATTRPETMFGDWALAVNANDSRYSHLIGKFAVIPYTQKKIPIISDEHADMEKGSGCVKITPAHDFNDFAVMQRHEFIESDIISILDKYGRLLNIDLIPEFLRGLNVKKARLLLLEQLKEDGLLIKQEEIIHTVPYGDRSNTVIEPMLTDQWFLDVTKFAPAAIEVVKTGKIKFYPEKWQNVFFNWMENIQPWCISRQITWGHQIPAWYTSNGEIIVARNEQEAQKKAPGQKLTRETDVLDTWFSSSLWPFATLGYPDNNELPYFPTSTIITGFDIIFFWIARMIMMTMYFTKQIPFKNIYIHALVRDTNGQKMSKSKGNVIDPRDLMKEFGTDALRYTLAFLSVPGRDIKFGRENVKISRNFMTKIWNAGRFLQTQNAKLPTNNVSLTHPIHHWIISKLTVFKNNLDANIKEYRFDYIAHDMQVFLKDQFCDFFIEAVKNQNDDNTKTIAAAVYAEFLKLSQPVIPFITTYLLGIFNKSEINLLDLPLNQELINQTDNYVSWIHNLRSVKKAEGENSENYKTLLKMNIPKEFDKLIKY